MRTLFILPDPRHRLAGNLRAHDQVAVSRSRVTDILEARCSSIAVLNRSTRTLSKPDGIYSSGVGQHLVKARHANLPCNAKTVDVSAAMPLKS